MKITYILLFLIFGINSYGQKLEETKNWTERYVKEAAGEKWRDCNLDTFNISRSDNSPILYFEIDTSFIIHIIYYTKDYSSYFRRCDQCGVEQTTKKYYYYTNYVKIPIIKISKVYFDKSDLIFNMKEDIEIQCKKKTDYYQDSGTKGCVRCEYYDDSNKYPQLITINNSKNIIKIPNISECLLDNYQERMLKSLNHLIKLSKEKYEDDTF